MQNLVPPYLDVLIQKLLSLLQNGQKLVQEGALTAMASVADCAKDSFAKYYTEASPLAWSLIAFLRSTDMLRTGACMH